MLNGKFYQVNDIASIVDRDKTTIIRWEKEGLLPKAQRDSRGWRVYSGREFRKIVALIQKTDYFQNPQALDKSQRLRVGSLSAVACVALLMVVNLFGLGFQNVKAFTNQTTTMFTTVNAGILDVVSASSSNSFSAVSVSFTAQTSTASRMGAFRISDARGSGAGWTVNLAANDWKSGEDVMQLDYNSTGSDGNLGKMCLIVSSGAIASVAGQSTSNITKGSLDCFSASVSQIDIYTAASSFGKGDYWITDFALEQFIPSNPTAQSYTTTIVLTVS